jgi:hypothetical protein
LADAWVDAAWLGDAKSHPALKSNRANGRDGRVVRF